LPGLEKLAQYGLLAAEESSSLAEAYCLLRDVEHRLQMEANLQTHIIPADHQAQERLARLMGFPALKAFAAAHQAHRHEVRRIFDQLFKGETAETKSSPAFPRQFEGAATDWKKLLSEHGFQDADKALRVL